MVHAKTIECVRKAGSLIEAGDADSLRYATLQLRMGIEYLFYELIPSYKDELPDDIMSKWQPKQIIDALLECDPLVDKDARIAITAAGASSPALVLRSKAVNKGILKDHYHRLGSFLHAPVDLVDP